MPSANTRSQKARPNSRSIEPGLQVPATIGEARRKALKHLARRSTREAHLESDLLLAHVLGVQRSHLYAHPQRRLAPDEESEFLDLLHRRGAGEPMQYLLGKVLFMEIEMSVDRRAFIPRPETETLVNTVLHLVPRPDFRFCDVGTGSGCIAIALAYARPAATGWATDICGEALQLARQNALACGVAGRMEFCQGDLLGAVAGKDTAFDVICSNPPYVTPAEFDLLAPEIREHEPSRALLAGEGGLEYHRRLIEEAPSYLKSHGLLVMEMAEGSGAPLSSLVGRGNGLVLRHIVPDFAGRDRVAVIQRRG